MPIISAGDKKKKEWKKKGKQQRHKRSRYG